MAKKPIVESTIVEMFVGQCDLPQGRFPSRTQSKDRSCLMKLTKTTRSETNKAADPSKRSGCNDVEYTMMFEM